MATSSHERPAIRRHELLVDVAARAAVILKTHGMDSARAQCAADAIVDDIADNWGGQYITVPKDMKYRHAKRCRDIVDEFNGSNHSELAAKFGLTVNGIYKILKRTRG